MTIHRTSQRGCGQTSLMWHGVYRLKLHFGFMEDPDLPGALQRMMRNASSASVFFNLPANQVIELGAQVEL